MAYRVRFEVEGFQCLRCGYKWVPRIFKEEDEEPTICPKCKSPYWNKPRRVDATPEVEDVMREAKQLKKEARKLAAKKAKD